MTGINFFSLCESVLEEADKLNLLDIAREATKWRAKYDQATSKKEKMKAKQQLIVAQDFLRDEFGRDLDDTAFQQMIVNHSIADRGLLHLTPVMLANLK